MTGDEIAAIRARLGLRVVDVAAVVGATSSSVYRWEAYCETTPNLEPQPRRMLLLLSMLAARPEALAIGRRIANAHASRGELAALHAALREVYG